jgi:Ca2+-binding EF-hand superfamily protein
MKNAQNDHLYHAESVQALIQGWLDHQWGEGCLKFKEVKLDLLQQVLVDFGIILPINFASFIDVLRRYIEYHLAQEPNAGFSIPSVQALQEIFDRHNPRGEEGLKGKALFAVLDDLGIAFHSKEERQWYVQTVKRLDQDKNGYISFGELCQIMRVVMDNLEIKKRTREFDLVKRSGLPFDEAEDWNMLFQATDEAGTGELEMMQLKELMQKIGITWDRDFADTITSWMSEVDENNNELVDFGEFCILTAKLWAHNTQDIRTKCRAFLQKDVTVSLKSIHGTFIATTASGEVYASSRDAGTNETFVMMMHSAASASFKTYDGKFIIVHEEKVQAEDQRAGTQFKLTQTDDDKIMLTASTSFGGMLYVTADGGVAVSDGNPNDAANTPLELVKSEDLKKKCWSRIFPKRRPSKLKNVADPRVPAMEPTSPTLVSSIREIDAHLEQSAIMSARGKGGC